MGSAASSSGSAVLFARSRFATAPRNCDQEPALRAESHNRSSFGVTVQPSGGSAPPFYIPSREASHRKRHFQFVDPLPMLRGWPHTNRVRVSWDSEALAEFEKTE